MSNTIIVTTHQSPAGQLLVGSIGDELCLLDWAVNRRRLYIDRRVCSRLNAVYRVGVSQVTVLVVNQLEEYFAGVRREFSVPVVFTGTDFQCRVYRELMKIPYGTTVSYRELAQRVGNARAVRAVAAANATNPISIVVPCHRVIGSDRTPVGYAGGVDAKIALLELERSATVRENAHFARDSAEPLGNLTKK